MLATGAATLLLNCTKQPRVRQTSQKPQASRGGAELQTCAFLQNEIYWPPGHPADSLGDRRRQDCFDEGTSLPDCVGLSRKGKVTRRGILGCTFSSHFSGFLFQPCLCGGQTQTVIKTQRQALTNHQKVSASAAKPEQAPPAPAQHHASGYRSLPSPRPPGRSSASLPERDPLS